MKCVNVRSVVEIDHASMDRFGYRPSVRLLWRSLHPNTITNVAQWPKPRPFLCHVTLRLHPVMSKQRNSDLGTRFLLSGFCPTRLYGWSMRFLIRPANLLRITWTTPCRGVIYIPTTFGVLYGFLKQQAFDTKRYMMKAQCLGPL